MRNATFQLHFYFYNDILIVINISVYKIFFISLSLEILNPFMLIFPFYIPDNIKRFITFLGDTEMEL